MKHVMRKLLPAMLVTVLMVLFPAVLANAADSGYVLMNIPYTDFYAAELDGGSVDAVTTATLKFENSGVAAGSYHETDASTDAESVLSGVTYPVFVSDLSALDAGLEVKANDTKTINIVSGREKTVTPTEVVGSSGLFCAPSYSWYKMEAAPARYKALTVTEGTFTFGAVSGRAQTVNSAGALVTYNGRHTNIEIRLSNTTGIENDTTVGGVVLTTADGAKYGLYHVLNIWQRTQLGWNLDELDLGGKTITNIRYITRDAVIDFPVELAIQNAGFVLMNIPYAEFYAAELNADSPAVDAVSSATKSKPLNSRLSGGSYHVNSDGSDISGVTYPVFVEDLSVLTGRAQVAEESALFGNDSYAYYRLAGTPARYKTLTVSSSGFGFGAVSGRAQTVNSAGAAVTYNGRHTNIEIKLSSAGTISSDTVVSGVILTTSDNAKYGLRHLVNIWRGTELGWNLGELDLGGKTITNIRYITRDAVIDLPVEIAVLSLQSRTVTLTRAGSTAATATVLCPEGAVLWCAAYDAQVEGRNVQWGQMFSIAQVDEAGNAAVANDAKAAKIFILDSGFTPQLPAVSVSRFAS